MSSKIYVTVKFNIILTVDDVNDIEGELNALEIFTESEASELLDYELMRYDITDSK